MQIQIEPGVHLFVDIEGPQWRVRGPQLQEVPTLVLIHGGPGFDHASFKPFFSALADRLFGDRAMEATQISLNR